MSVPTSRRTVALFVTLLSAAAFTRAQEPAAVSSSAPSSALASPAPDASPAGQKEAKSLWSQVHVNGQYIAMTFDDGPSAKLTPHLLDILKERNMHVTFFVLGEMVKPHPEILQRAVAEGHEIGNHSWDHPDLAKKSDEFVRSQLDRTKDEITAAIGKPVTLMRPPYGSLSKEQRRWVHDDLGYTIILWDVDPLDWKKPVTPAQVEQRILEHTQNGSIILSHDIHPTTVEAMPDTFDKLLAKGYKFVTVSELIAMNQPEPPKPAGKGKPGANTAAAPTAHPAAHTAPTPVLPDKITGAPGQ